MLSACRLLIVQLHQWSKQCPAVAAIMCGIWALLGLSDEDVRKRCVECFKICHRGPDACRIETIPDIPDSCLGFQRLRINGLVKGMQPMRLFVLPHIWLLYNGEIYNAFTLRDQYDFHFDTQCDGEIIIHLYERFGAETMARMLDGVFAFIVVDTKKNQVHLGRDIFGVRPMFTFNCKGKASRDASILGTLLHCALEQLWSRNVYMRGCSTSIILCRFVCRSTWNML